MSTDRFTPLNELMPELGGAHEAWGQHEYELEWEGESEAEGFFDRLASLVASGSISPALRPWRASRGWDRDSCRRWKTSWKRSWKSVPWRGSIPTSRGWVGSIQSRESILKRRWRWNTSGISPPSRRPSPRPKRTRVGSSPPP
jgi:hypothetical protein